MKQAKLKPLIESIIRESIINKLVGEGQPVGGVKNDHEFDAGRHGVMKAVNVDEKIGFDGKYVDDMESGTAVKRLHKLDEDDEEEKIPGKFVNRGDVKLEGGVDYKTASKIADRHWDVFGSSPDEKGVWNFKTRGERWCCSVGKLHGQLAMLSITTESGRLQLLVGKELISGMKEQSASGAAGAFATPKAFKKESKMNEDPSMSFGELSLKAYFRIPGYDNLFQKISNTEALNLGTGGMLNKPTSIGRSKKINIPGDTLINPSGLSEMTGTGAVAGYATPFAFTKNKKGSKRALNITKKLGFKEV